MATPIPYTLIDTPLSLKQALRLILTAHSTFTHALLSPTTPLLYVDIEGRDLSRHGTISLIQIHIPLVRQTLILDAFVLGGGMWDVGVVAGEEDLRGREGGEGAFPGVEVGGLITLKSIFESKGILKCLFDCRNDADALYNLSAISLAGVVDVQILEIATRRGSKRLLNGLARAIKTDAMLDEEVLKEWLEVKGRGKALFNADRAGATPPTSPTGPGLVGSSDSSSTSPVVESSSSETSVPVIPAAKPEPDFGVFEVRPLSKDLLEYSVNDVIHLPRLWALYDAKLDAKWREKTENEVKWRLQLAKQDVYYGRNGNMALGPF